MYILYSCFVLTSPRVAYLYNNPRWPRPEKRTESDTARFPPSLRFRFCVPAASSHPLRPALRICQPCRWSHMGPSRAASPHLVSFKWLARSHLPFPSRAPSRSEDNNSRLLPLVHSCVRSRLGNTTGFYHLFLSSNSCGGSSPSIWHSV